MCRQSQVTRRDFSFLKLCKWIKSLSNFKFSAKFWCWQVFLISFGFDARKLYEIEIVHQIDLNLKSLVISPHFHEIECNPPSNIRRSSNAGWSWIFPLFTAGSGCVVAGRLSHKTLGLVLSSHNYTANIVLVWLPVTRELSQPAGSGRDWSHSLGLCCASLWSSHSSHTPSLTSLTHMELFLQFWKFILKLVYSLCSMSSDLYQQCRSYLSCPSQLYLSVVTAQLI